MFGQQLFHPTFQGFLIDLFIHCFAPKVVLTPNSS